MTNEDHGVTVTEEEPPPAKCPVLSGAEPTSAIASTANQHWWPNQLNLKVLNQHPPQSDPLGADFDYAAAFNTLDLAAVKSDLMAVMTDSQD